MTLSKRLSIFFLFISLIPLLTVGAIAYISGRQTIQTQAINHLYSTNILKQAELDAWLQEKTAFLELAANSHYVKSRFPENMLLNGELHQLGLEEKNQLKRDFFAPYLKNGGFFELFIMEPEKGSVIVSSDQNQEGKVKKDQPYFKEGKSRTYIQNVYYSMSIREPAITISAPLKLVGGELMGVLAARVDISTLSKIISRRSSRLKTEDTYLVNKFNFFITEPLFGEDYALKKTIHTEGVALALEKSEGFAFYKDYRGIPVIGAYRWVPDKELAIITEVDQSEAYAPIYRLRKTIALFGLVIAFTSAFLGLIFARTITRPLAKLAQSAGVMGTGDLETEIVTSAKGEVGSLARSLDQMRRELKESLVSKDRLIKEAARRKAAMADLERSNQELEQFAYVASHDLQEPLRMVASYTQLLAQRYEGQLDEKANKYIGYIVEGATRMQHLVNDLLQLSRVGTRGAPFEPTDCNEVVQQVLKSLKRTIAETKAGIVVDDLPVVQADAIQLGQVFQNLIANALKFRGDDPPAVRISAEKNETAWTFQVHDNGIGIDPSFHDRIFIIFQRLHERGKYEGTGIGLAIVKKIVERHGGRIWIESQEGKGASFFFSIPEKGQDKEHIHGQQG
ncbi:His Kinase A (phospho-acceptor) domain-containing protein [Desulfatibacillum alkenivorans DSM 16219]|jgi:signal transduction histidine kinase|uniref:histidine kinase n=1 Tax=Desulfatibacillum alkenivorans DSM 16219 TaxID=1121393 RepID=A0A1M6L4V3_9BACT|nr:ATP-binding protein [Desulfatibacillum alkenivorans]SHJ66237.1 His Kinase A (phospho-acceptor) domain-containing protein [Desulfatibacillum alkenivorans DSM 16219]